MLIDNKAKRTHVNWSSEEKQFLANYVKETPRGPESIIVYWQKCANQINIAFPEFCRNGNSCKSLVQRLYVSPSSAVYFHPQEFFNHHVVRCWNTDRISSYLRLIDKK